MSNKAEVEEIWKTYPDYPWVEASNLGKIRTKDRYVKVKGQGKRFVKGRVLKQHDNGNGYMCVCFRVNGKEINLLVHRAVATCFLTNHNNLPEVNHKDNDPTNNAVSNLEWCTRQYNIDYKKNFGTTSVDIQGQPVFAVDLETGKVVRFESQSEAERQLDISVGSVCDVINGRQNTAGGYWFAEDESEITDEKIQEIKAKMYFFGGVIAINLDTGKIFWFESQSEAARQLGVDRRDLNNVIKGRQKTAHDYCFTYADEKAVEKARAKFGDEIAEKVEELIKQNQ